MALQVQCWVCAGQRLGGSSDGQCGLLCSPDLPGSATREAAGRTLCWQRRCGWQHARGRLPMGAPFTLAARLHRLLPGSVGDPTPSCSSSHGRDSGKAQAARTTVEEGLPRPAGHRAAQGVPDCSWPPAPGPFFPLLFVQDLLIWEQGPFMWRWASPGLPVPPMAGDFLFIWR